MKAKMYIGHGCCRNMVMDASSVELLIIYKALRLMSESAKATETECKLARQMGKDMMNFEPIVLSDAKFLWVCPKCGYFIGDVDDDGIVILCPHDGTRMVKQIDWEGEE